MSADRSAPKWQAGHRNMDSDSNIRHQVTSVGSYDLALPVSLEKNGLGISYQQ